MRARSSAVELDVGRSEVLLEVRAALRARDRRRCRRPARAPTRARAGPASRPSPRRAPRTFAASVRFCSSASPGEARAVAAEVVRRRARRGTLKRPDRKPRPSGEYGDEADSELAARVEDLGLGVARPERVLGLQRGDRVHRVRAADRLGRRLAQAEVAHLALARRARPSRRWSPRSGPSGRRGAGSRGRRGRCPRRFSEPSIERRTFSGEPSSTRFVGLSSVGAKRMPDLRRDHHLVAVARDRLADELLVGERPVHLGRVEERAAELERAVDGGDRPHPRRRCRRRRTCPCSRGRGRRRQVGAEGCAGSCRRQPAFRGRSRS